MTFLCCGTRGCSGEAMTGEERQGKEKMFRAMLAKQPTDINIMCCLAEFLCLGGATQPALASVLAMMNRLVAPQLCVYTCMLYKHPRFACCVRCQVKKVSQRSRCARPRRFTSR